MEVLNSRSDLRRACDSATELMNTGETQKALDACNLLVEKNRGRREPLRARADVYMHEGDYESAALDLDQLIQQGSGEPADLYDLGCVRFRLGEFQSTIAALSTCIELGRQSEFGYYEDAAILFRAEARFRIGDSSGAIQDCALLDQDYAAYVPGQGLRSVSEILSAARRLER